MYIARPIRAEDAKYMVTRYHYSGKVVSNSQIHPHARAEILKPAVGVDYYIPEIDGGYEVAHTTIHA